MIFLGNMGISAIGAVLGGQNRGPYTRNRVYSFMNHQHFQPGFGSGVRTEDPSILCRLRASYACVRPLSRIASTQVLFHGPVQDISCVLNIEILLKQRRPHNTIKRGYSKMDFTIITVITIYAFAASCTVSTSASKDEDHSKKTKCVIGYLNSCLEHQKCVGISVGGRAGYCDCLEGYIDVEDELGRQVSDSGSQKLGHESHNES